MKKLITIATLFLACVNWVYSQQTAPPAAPATPATPGTTQQTQPTQQSQNNNEQQRATQISQQRAQESFNNLRRLSDITAYESVKTSSVMRLNISPLYRKPNKKELKPFEPDPADIQRYANFLKQKHTGIFTLVPDAGCSNDSKVLVVSPECLEHQFPGAGSSYSFRIENYRLPDLADITYMDGVIGGAGVLVGKVFVDLGERDLESVNLNSPGMKYLTEFPVSKTSQDAYEISNSIMNGITRDNFVYGLGVYAKENSTSAVRLIAYNARHLKFVEGVTYDEFGFDKRRDIIVAFRVIRKDEDGRITILWKELQNKKAPKIKIVDADTKEDSE